MKTFIRFIAFAFVLIVSSQLARAETEYKEHVIGKADAPVTIIEYASYTCSHCADFHTNVLPHIKKDFVDTGKVKIIFRDFPFERVGATAAMLSRCVAPDRFEGFSALLMKQQDQWAHSENPVEGLLKLAKLAGMSQEMIDSCLADEKLLDKIIATRKEATDEHGFDSTPSFLINDEKVVGSGTYDKFKTVILSQLSTEQASPTQPIENKPEQTDKKEGGFKSFINKILGWFGLN